MTLFLSQELYDHCRMVLLRCRQFQGHASLRAVFVTTELAAYRDDLPECASRDERVDVIIDYLLQNTLSDGRPVFHVFLEALRRRYEPGDELFDHLTQLCFSVRKELLGIGEVDIPFVVAAMTHSEAENLLTGSAFENPGVAPAEQTSFHSLKDTFREDVCSDWLSHYGQERDDWRPHTHARPTDTIRAMISRTADRLNQGPEVSSLVRPTFYSAQFLSSDDKNRVETWERLSGSGCVIIVDAVSLFHPVIYRRLLQSEMSSNRQVAIAVLVLSPEANQANALIEQEVKTRFQRAFARFDWYDDLLCNLDVRQWRGLRRWLQATLPKMAERVQLVPRSTAREMMQEQIGETHGMGDLISGQRW